MSNYSELIIRKRFAIYIMRHWKMNDHNLENISCVYAMLSIDIFSKIIDIVYFGSITQLLNRYKSHKVPSKIQKSGKINIMYFKPMDKGFYDYEIRLIRKLKPIYNKQHRNG